MSVRVPHVTSQSKVYSNKANEKKKTSRSTVLVRYETNPMLKGGFPLQRTRNVESTSMA